MFLHQLATGIAPHRHTGDAIYALSIYPFQVIAYHLSPAFTHFAHSSGWLACFLALRSADFTSCLVRRAMGLLGHGVLGALSRERLTDWGLWGNRLVSSLGNREYLQVGYKTWSKLRNI